MCSSYDDNYYKDRGVQKYSRYTVRSRLVLHAIILILAEYTRILVYYTIFIRKLTSFNKNMLFKCSIVITADIFHKLLPITTLSTVPTFAHLCILLVLGILVGTRYLKYWRLVILCRFVIKLNFISKQLFITYSP